MRDLTIIKTQTGKSSNAWKQKKGLPGIIKNWGHAWFASRIPAVNNYCYRRMGVKIGKGVQIMPDIRMEIFFPELIEIGDNVVIGQETFFTCHEFNVSYYLFLTILNYIFVL